MASKKRVKADKLTINGVEVQYYIQDGKVVDDKGNPAPAGIASAILGGQELQNPPPPKKARNARGPTDAQQQTAARRARLGELNQRMQAGSTSGGGFAGNALESAVASEYNQVDAAEGRRSLGGAAKGVAKAALGGMKATAGLAGMGILKGLGIEELLPAAVLTNAFSSDKEKPQKGGGTAASGGISKDLVDSIVSTDNNILEAVKISNNLLEDIIGILDENKRLQIERDREAAARATRGIAGQPGSARGGAGEASGGWLKVIQNAALALAGVLGAMSGTLIGYVKNFIKLGEYFYNGIMKGLKSIMSLFAEDGMFAALGARITKGVKMITGLFEAEGALGSVTKIFSGISEIFSSIMKPISKAFGYVKSLFKYVGEFGAFIGEMVPFFGRIASFFKFGLKAFPIVGEIIMVIEGLWDTVSGAIEGFKKDGVVGLITGAIKGFFGSFVGGFLDDVKGLTSWVANLFGFENVSKWLDSFSFEEFINNFVDNVTNLVKGVGTAIADAISTAWNFITELPKKALGWIGDAIGSVSSTVKGWWNSLVGGGTSGGLNEGGTTKLESTQNVAQTPEGKVYTKGVVEQKSAGGSTGAGALLTEKGKQSGGFSGVQATTSKTGESGMIELQGKRTSGGIFGSDTYEIVDTKNNKKVQVAKSDYFDIQKLVADGKVKEAHDKLQKIAAAQEAEKEASLRGDTTEYDAMGNVTGIGTGSSMAMVAKSGEQAAASATQQPIVVPVPSGGGAAAREPSPPTPAPRTSGAVATAPQQSHIDRALYGDLFGAGVP